MQRDYVQLIQPNHAQSALCLAPFGDEAFTGLLIIRLPEAVDMH